MNKTLATAIAPLFLLISHSAIAKDEHYVGASYIMYNFSQSGLDDLQPDGLLMVLGSHLNENFLLEARVGRSLSDDNVTGAAMKVDDFVGFYVKGGKEFGNIVFPYVALGFTKVDYEFWGAPVAYTKSDLSYGIGADVKLGKFKLGAEWMTLQDKSDFKLESLSFTGAWMF